MATPSSTSTSSSTASATTTKSGIHKLPNGSTIIPASTRPDGTTRKEIRVKPGYKPPEDVEVYKNKTAEGWKKRGKAGVPGVEVEEEKLPPHKAAAAKNARRREARRRAAGEEKGGEVEGDEGAGGAKNGFAGIGQSDSATQAEAEPEAEAAKEARKLAKKLRQARELKEKKEKGDALLPEQFAKVIKIQELIRQLDGLGFDAEGEKKIESGREEDGESAG
ncbi:hypothetical protein B0A55_00789 [Friedmanniomyces simplex]|uniref:WIBG Mago-binding domain-containing protein n=1 Tax=Friedmanniomyces simplex TaxID=329884 RepID=A0A4U0Y1I5_9PEZI|nr:hypothetical protein B0A55_00789 [Friedmanniomyces simplex]